jgi:membrane protein implicated in regulation of membrane protease activity
MAHGMLIYLRASLAVLLIRRGMFNGWLNSQPAWHWWALGAILLAIAAETFVNGRGAVLIDDTRWNATVTDGSSPQKGDMLRVLAADGADLKVQTAA